MTYLDDLSGELGRVGIRGSLRARILAETADHLAEGDVAQFGEPGLIAQRFADELATAQSRRAAFRSFAALGGGRHFLRDWMAARRGRRRLARHRVGGVTVPLVAVATAATRIAALRSAVPGDAGSVFDDLPVMLPRRPWALCFGLAGVVSVLALLAGGTDEGPRNAVAESVLVIVCFAALGRRLGLRR